MALLSTTWAIPTNGSRRGIHQPWETSSCLHSRGVGAFSFEPSQ